MSGTVCLVTGANRGIGEALVVELLKRPDATVIAAVQAPSEASHLEKLDQASGSRLIIVKYEATREGDAKAVAEELRTQHGIDRLDLVMANAGVGKECTRVLDLRTDNALEHFTVNALAPVWLAASTADLLRKSSKPVFVTMSSMAGSIEFQAEMMKLPLDSTPYGMSKAASNWLNQRLHQEEDWLLTFGFHPGMVITDMVRGFFDKLGPGTDLAAFGAMEPPASAQKMLAALDGATREKHGGRLVNYDGEILPW